MCAMTPARALWGMAVIAAVLAFAGAAPAASGRKCDVSRDGRRLGTTYVTSLRVQHVGCARAKTVVKAFNACRKASGGVRGRCHRRVLGYRCSERRGPSIPTQFDSKVTCKAASRVVRFSYTQFT
jgi:hypothetical protein